MLKKSFFIVFIALALLGDLMAQNIGLHVTKAELELWRTRALNGPYKIRHDMSTNSPGDWTRIVENANTFLQNPSADLYYGGSGGFTTEPHNNHVKMRDAAFVYLITGDSRYFNAVKNQLLAQIAISGVDCSKWPMAGDTHRFIAAEWFVRLLFSYDYIKTGLSSTERSRLDQWFLKAGNYYAANINQDIRKLFPYRLNEDYSRTEREATSGEMSSSYTHVNKNGTQGNRISLVALWYNNRRSSMVRAFGLVGVFLNDKELIRQSKIYIKEMIKYSTYPDGTMGEYHRNGNYGNPQSGKMYSSVNILAACEIADALARKGDFELYQYSTGAGLHGTVGGNKNIRLLVKNFYNQVDYTVERYYRSVDIRNRIDGENEFGGEYGQERFVNDVWFSMSNRYWKDSYFQKVIKRQVGPKYPEKAAGGWSGPGGTYPGLLFMFEHNLDIFSNQVVSPTPPPVEEEQVVGNSGLDYYYYEGSWNALPDFKKLTHKTKGVSQSVNINSKQRADNFGFVFEGYIKVPSSDSYRFFLNSDDGAKLFINNNLLINNDGLHAALEKSGTVTLSAGNHLIRVEYFEKAGQEVLVLSYESSTLKKMEVPGTVLFRSSNVTAPTPPPPTPPSSSSNSGLKYAYYEGFWDMIPDFSRMIPVKQGSIENFSTAPRLRVDGFGFSFTGYINIPSSRDYTFFITSDDGSRLFINDTQIINNDGTHAARERSASIYLTAGKHKIRVSYFDKHSGDILSVKLSSQIHSKQAIPSSWLSHDNSMSASNARMNVHNEEAPTTSYGELAVYPNPFKNSISFNGISPQVENVSVVVYNQMGHIVHEERFSGNMLEGKSEIDLSFLTKGIYIVTLKSDDFDKSIFKMIKE